MVRGGPEVSQGFQGEVGGGPGVRLHEGSTSVPPDKGSTRFREGYGVVWGSPEVRFHSVPQE